MAKKNPRRDVTQTETFSFGLRQKNVTVAHIIFSQFVLSQNQGVQ